MAKIYNLFISHSWAYGDAYERLKDLLNSAPNFQYRDYSVPRDDPVHDAPNVNALYQAIKVQMTFCHVVLLMGGVYASYSKWIDREIECATEDLNKPIIGIRPWGNERISTAVQDAALTIVNWNSASIVAAIREHSL